MIADEDKDLDLLKEATQYDSFAVSHVNECEFITLSPNGNVLSVR
jgi:hypothetical protein